MRKIRLSIAQKLIYSFGLLVLLSFGLLVFAHLVKLYHSNLRESELQAQTESMAYINPFARTMDETTTLLETLEACLLELKKNQFHNRENAITLLKEVLADNPELLGVYTLWEPNAFDGNDANNRNKNSYDDATGRFIPYVVRENESINVFAIENYDDKEKGMFYQLPKLTKSFTLLEPYIYEINGQSTWMTSLVLPLLDEQGRFLGIVGADISLDSLQKQIEKFHPLGGYATIVTTENRYLVNGRSASLINTPYQLWSTNDELEAMKGTSSRIAYTSDPSESGTVLRMFYPILIHNVLWHIETVIPKKKMLPNYYSSLWESILITSVALLFMAAAMAFLVRKIILVNIHKVVRATSAFAAGSGEQRLNIHTNDEFEFMALHFNNMLTQRKEAERVIEYQSTHDLLTGLPNRYAYHCYMDEQSTQNRHQDSHYALLFIDLDRFKMINDTLDHAMGDQLLKQMADRIVNAVGAAGRVFRFGGDEYIALLEDVPHLHLAAHTADAILKTISAPIQLKDRMFYITASIGISIQHEWTPAAADQLIKEADIAMYVAKKEHNTSKVYTASMNDVTKREQLLESSMLQALELGQFMLYYQPKVEVATGRIYGAEALIRWSHPELGMVSPLDFIPIAEKTGFIIPLGEWVLFTACQQMKEWERMGLPQLSVSVNMSMIQFQQKQIVHTIERILTEAGIRPEQLELEITESIFMDNAEHTLTILHELKQLGVKLSLDDFGTGYSSLSYLQNIPLHTLKLDKSFINGIVDDFKKQMIFKSVIVIAHNLNLNVVTEGVETQEELEIICGHQCDAIQGYIYSPPVPAERFAQLFIEHNKNG
ncbi:diguanylate cyclase (GGDEF)-like protein [Paenibacillus endophyticus]|uniref:Diguanylate cyclase (GGDEF)-like protein n=1 Tax=Paenibacillus endophyticus TaxID=1294268 RepID=A0A7W5GAA0_9BACL|nr:EAL domain-containing protein [Paenibacillus endophyticus]MBB3152546.1 diguanylate cyclase (GGDEF)-like protein [Paenibacillus endophyticus]